MSGINPYSCVKPGNLFVGHEELLRELKTDLKNGDSFALLGGRRIGKTSLLRQLEKELKEEEFFQPYFLDMMEFGRVTPNRFFEEIYRLLIQDDSSAPQWKKEKREKSTKIFVITWIKFVSKRKKR